MAAPPLALDNTMGAAYIGVVTAAAMLGILCVQTSYYFSRQKDRWPTKMLVAAVMVSDTIHQILISHTVYVYTIKNYNNPLFLGNLVWSLLVEVLFNGLTTLLVQGFLTLRVWRLSNRNIWLTSIVILLVVAEFVPLLQGCVVAYTTLSLQLETFVDLQQLKALSISVNTLAAAGDVLIALVLSILLYRSRTGFHRSGTVINKLILFAVNTGFLTSLCAVASLISIVVAGNTFLYIAFYFCIGRLYSNALLATLNARQMIRGSANGNHTTSISLQELPKHHPIFSRRPNNVSVKINTTQVTVSDSDQGQELRGENKLEGVPDSGLFAARLTGPPSVMNIKDVTFP